MPHLRPAALTATVLTVLALPAADAHARAILVASGDAAATITDTATNRTLGRIPVGGRTVAAAIAPDGNRGYVATQNRVVVLDVGGRTAIGTYTAGGTIRSMALTTDGARLLVARRGAIELVDALTLQRVGAVSLGGATPGAIAVAAGGQRAAVTLRDKLGIVDLVGNRLSRRAKSGTLNDVAFTATGALWATSPKGRAARLRPRHGQAHRTDQAEGGRRRRPRDLPGRAPGARRRAAGQPGHRRGGPARPQAHHAHQDGPGPRPSDLLAGHAARLRGR